MSDENTPSSIVEALERAAALQAEVRRQVEELLRDEDVEELSDDDIDMAFREA